MSQEYLFEPIPCDKYDLLSKDELVILHKEEGKVIKQLNSRIKELTRKLDSHEQSSLMLSDDYLNLKNKVFGKSSEKSKKSKKRKKETKPRGKRVQLPSERYPNLPVRVIYLDEHGNVLSGSAVNLHDPGCMWETTEQLNVIPKRYEVLRCKRRVIINKSEGILVGPSPLARILPGSSYSDEMILDVSLSKFCDLIPIERYVQMARRESGINLPQNSLINLTHQLAQFFAPAAALCREEVKDSEITKADETPHKMLENKSKSKKKDKGNDSWYLWGFSCDTACYFDIQNTRSGDIAHKFLQDSECRYLMSDVYSGYKKAVRLSNEYRKKHNLLPIIKIYCNSHARRYFKNAERKYPKEAAFFIKMYRRIYKLEDICGKVPPDKKARIRLMMMDYAFHRMEQQIIKIRNNYPNKSSIAKAMNYYFNNYKELTLCTVNPDLPLDNNSQESLLRPPVVGRKTWYGTHSEQGAETTAIMFTLVGSCKINNVNPREYFRDLTKELLQGRLPFTPYEYAQRFITI